MARLKKQGVEYFPLNVDMDTDDKIFYIQAAHGILGFGVLIKIFMRVYKHGYYSPFTEKDMLIFAAKNNIEVNVCKNIINTCINEGIFDRNIFNQYQILTSKGVQNRYFEISKRRDFVNFTPEITLIDVSAYKNLVNVDINSINVNISTQMKVNEMKVNEMKVNEMKVNEMKEERIVKENIDNVPNESGPASEKFDNDSEEPNTGSNIAKSGRTAKASNNAKQPKKAKLTDEEWLESLKSNPAYAGIDVAVLKGKLIVWCELKGKQPTRARLLNWLNREERPMSSKVTPMYSRNSAAAMRMIEKIREDKAHELREG